MNDFQNNNSDDPEDSKEADSSSKEDQKAHPADEPVLGVNQKGSSNRPYERVRGVDQSQSGRFSMGGAAKAYSSQDQQGPSSDADKNPGVPDQGFSNGGHEPDEAADHIQQGGEAPTVDYTLDESSGVNPTDLNRDQKKIKILEDEVAAYKDRYARSVAETENVRKRAARERQDVTKYAISSFAKDLLDFADNFHRALDSIPSELKEEDERIKSTVEGLDAMERELSRLFERHGIQKMEPMDQIFDPNYHEVMFEGPAEGKPAGTIIHLVEPGYMLHDRLLRPARVGVAKEDGSQSSQSNSGSSGGNNINEEF